MIDECENLKAWFELVLFERYQVKLKIASLDGFWVISEKNSFIEIRIKKNHSFYKLGVSNLDCYYWSANEAGLTNPLNIPLVVLGCARKNTDLIELASEGSTINFDILGLTYWCLSRSEEVNPRELDNHQRFSAKFSHAYRNDYLERPIVDEWLHILGQVIQKTWPEVEPKKNKFSVKVSHDVDAPSQFGFVGLRRFVRRCGASVLIDHNLKNVVKAPFIRLFTKRKLLTCDAYNSFDWLMDLSDKHNLTSAFYFICGCTDFYKDADYNVAHPAIRNLMRKIHRRGHEIGLHPSFNTFLDKNKIQVELDRLLSVCLSEGVALEHVGGRMHYLRWEQPYTMQAWNDCGLAYDSTMSYADHAGFRCGTCFEYPAYNPVTQEILDLRIRPLIAMECSIIDQTYMGLGVGEESKNKFLELAKKCAQVGGCFTTLWHNSEFSSRAKRSLYAEILAEIHSDRFLEGI